MAKDSINRDLYFMSGRLQEHAAELQAQAARTQQTNCPSPDQPEFIQPQPTPSMHQTTPGTDSSKQQAEQRRLKELSRLRRDLQNTILEEQNTLAPKLEQLSTQIRELQEYESFLSMQSSLLAQLPDTPILEELQPTARTLEKIRIELLRQQTRQQREESVEAKTSGGNSFLPELLSMNMHQWLKIGWGLTWPVALAILLAAAIMAVASIAAVRW